MDSIEESIPAFSMWKMFNKTIIPALLNMEYTDASLQKLRKIIKTQEFLSIFVYRHDPALPIKENEDISYYYETFMRWLLGRLFYLLTDEKLTK